MRQTDVVEKIISLIDNWHVITLSSKKINFSKGKFRKKLMKVSKENYSESI